MPDNGKPIVKFFSPYKFPMCKFIERVARAYLYLLLIHFILYKTSCEFGCITMIHHRITFVISCSTLSSVIMRPSNFSGACLMTWGGGGGIYSHTWHNFLSKGTHHLLTIIMPHSFQWNTVLNGFPNHCLGVSLNIAPLQVTLCQIIFQFPTVLDIFFSYLVVDPSNLNMVTGFTYTCQYHCGIFCTVLRYLILSVPCYISHLLTPR